MPPPQMMGIYPPDSVQVCLPSPLASVPIRLPRHAPLTAIQEASHSLALDPLAPGVADILASDIEHKLHLIIQEARKFMVHGKRGTLMPEDVEYAMEALNVEVCPVVSAWMRRREASLSVII